MSNNQTFVNDVLSLINVLPSNMDASAEDGELALRVADELVDEWADDNIVVTWSPAAALADECPLEGTEKTAMKYHLAIRLCPHFGREPSAVIMALADTAYRKLQRAIMARATDPQVVQLPAAEGDWGGYNILTDE
jgi:hypothetical protein